MMGVETLLSFVFRPLVYVVMCVCVCVYTGNSFRNFFFFKPVVVFDFFVSVHCHTQMVYLSIDRPHAKPDLKP